MDKNPADAESRIAALAASRRRAFAWIAVGVVLVLAPMRACVSWQEATPGGTDWASGPAAPWIVLGLFAACWGLGGRFVLMPALGAIVGHRDRLAQTLFLPLVQEAFPGARHAAEEVFDRALYTASGLFAEGDGAIYVGTGVYHAEVGGRRVQAAELWVRTHTGPSGMGQTYLAFRGLFCAFVLGRPFPGRLVLDPRKAPFPTTGAREGLQEVTTGDPELERRYRVWSDSPAAATSWLAQAPLRSALLALHDESRAPGAAALCADWGFVGEQSGDHLFDDNVGVRWDARRIESIRRTLAAVARVVAAT